MLASLFFLSPFTIMIGGALIASPIIIHLINRMRFKRVRWAAMEFLLKAQKRSRKRMIIEQLILLLLRILLVILIAVLLSRLVEKKETPPEDPVNQNKEPPKITKHIVLLDDSASMADRWRQEEGAERGQEVFAHSRARKVVNEYIVDVVRDDNKPHEFVIIKTSKPDAPRDFQLLTGASQEEIEKYLKEDYKAEPFHYDLQTALDQAKKLIDDNSSLNLVLHIVSDFRATDWNDATKDSLGKIFEHFEKAKVQVKLHDVAAPKRERDKPLISSENLAIVEFRPESRVVIKDFPVEFTVTVANYSNSDRQNVLIRVKVNNEEKRDGTVNIPLVRANDTVTARVVFSLNRTAPKDLNSARGETAKFDGFNLVSAQIENQFAGLAIDDVRYTVVEVRDNISLLLVDNNILARGTKNAESFYLWKLFSDTFKGFDVEVKTANEMEKMNLARFSAVVLCDIPSLTPVGVQKLESFINGGGGVGFFMGSSIRDPKFYNEVLWKDGKGMFPLPLKEVANKNATLEQLNQILFEQRLSFNKKLLVRKEIRRHPAMEKLYSDSRGQNFTDDAYEKIFYLVSFARYYVVDRPKWNPGDSVQTLLYLPNTRSIADFERQTKDLLRKLRETTDLSTRKANLEQKMAETKDELQRQAFQQRIDQLPAELERFQKFQKTVKEYSDTINNTVGKYDNPLHKLVLWMEILLEDPGDANSKTPSMIEFWQSPELAEIKQEFLQLLDVIKYGDPFYVAKQYGKGRVLAFMGSAGASGPEGGLWNPLNAPGREYFPPLMKDSLQRYLCSTSSDFFLSLGKPFDYELEAADYDPVVQVWQAANNERPATDEDKIKFTNLGVGKNIETTDTQLKWKFAEGNSPGMYLFEFAPKSTEGPKKEANRADIRSLAYNFDTKIESNLQRARTDDLTTIAKVESVETMDEANPPKAIAKESVKTFEPDKDSDDRKLGWSRSPWLFLGMLLVLILEQAWAVRLSFHVREGSGPIIPRGLTRGPVVG